MLTLALLFPPPRAVAAENARHVVIVVMDGLRPDAVTPEDMPTLSALARSGTFFANHHTSNTRIDTNHSWKN